MTMQALYVLISQRRRHGQVRTAMRFQGDRRTDTYTPHELQTSHQRHIGDPDERM